MMTVEEAAVHLGMAERRLHEAITAGELVVITEHGNTFVTLPSLRHFLCLHSRRMGRMINAPPPGHRGPRYKRVSDV